MSDVITHCTSAATPKVSGRVVTKLPGCAVQTITPKINQQMPVSVAIAKYDDRFDEVGYYFDKAAQ